MRHLHALQTLVTETQRQLECRMSIDAFVCAVVVAAEGAPPHTYWKFLICLRTDEGMQLLLNEPSSLTAPTNIGPCLAAVRAMCFPVYAASLLEAWEEKSATIPAEQGTEMSTSQTKGTSKVGFVFVLLEMQTSARRWWRLRNRATGSRNIVAS
ncbi:unnamed protein product [Hydatigera taeniaeformis]|uniref:Uncharacterized protein n=1 Tax=Hydatigena taeniaeformis TaxID=6205 RepID=A0A0R3WPF9_HYDTA|nr:unnamed protein product [Hydatigera taeniaeformis]